MRVSVITRGEFRPVFHNSIMQVEFGESASITELAHSVRFDGGLVGKVYEIDETDLRYLERFGSLKLNKNSVIRAWNTPDWDSVAEYFTRVAPGFPKEIENGT